MPLVDPRLTDAGRRLHFGGVRTDRTQLCAMCGIRMSQPRCPQCGRELVFDLMLPQRRAWGLENARRRQRRRGGVFWTWQLVVVPAVTLWIAWATPGSRFPFFAWWVLAGIPVWASERRRPKFPQLRLPPPPRLDPAAERISVEGVVRVTRPCRAPLSGRACAAFRVVGAGPTGPIDDAGVGAFEVLTSDRGVVSVDTSAATVALPVFGPPTPIAAPPPAELREFLAVRGAMPERGVVRLAEAVLSDGDRARVTGTAEQLAARLEYRDGYVPVLRERPGSPLIIERTD